MRRQFLASDIARDGNTTAYLTWRQIRVAFNREPLPQECTHFQLYGAFPSPSAIQLFNEHLDLVAERHGGRLINLDSETAGIFSRTLSGQCFWGLEYMNDKLAVEPRPLITTMHQAVNMFKQWQFLDWYIDNYYSGGTLDQRDKKPRRTDLQNRMLTKMTELRDKLQRPDRAHLTP